ncbi:MAG: dehydrogenase E1 component subunit alpha/beta [Saprospiraceae bacterium]|nr:dehydrogenase E1 component subunit alpha/beta [Saprospiraceae bacterium]
MARTSTMPIAFKKGRLAKSTLLDIYKQLVYPRVIEEKMLSLLRQGKISKWFSGIGQEAISVGCTLALEEDEMIFTMHRNLGVFTARQVPFQRLFAQWQGKISGFSNGRERSFHFGTLDYAIAGMISHLGPQLSLADGVGLAHKLAGQEKVALAFTGEGGTSEGEFHEALNVAAVWELPVIFIIENNGYGLSTPTKEQYRCENLADRAKGYGMEGIIIDGNNILEVYNTIRNLAQDLRKNPRPVLVECRTFRMRGHEEASGTKYVPKELMEEWALKDPIANYEAFLIEEGILTADEAKTIKASYKKDIEKALKVVFEEPEPTADTDAELEDVYRAFEFSETQAGSETKEMRFVDAISDGLNEAMKSHDNLVLMGQDIAEYGGVFKITDGFVNDFGVERVRNTPLCESAIIGAALGLSFKGYKSMVEMQFADFVTCGFNQIVNNLAKIHYRWGPNADVVVRMPTGAGVGAGPFHSQSNEAWFTHVPGLKVVYPSNPIDAKGLLLTSFEDPNPVMFFEHKGLYRSLSAEVPTGYYTIPFGKANLVSKGDAVSIITYGMGVHWAQKAISQLQIEADILDLRTLVPLDLESIRETVERTGKVLILHEDTLFGGIGGEIAAFISEHLFDHLDAPVVRVASLDSPIPFAIPLEQNFLPQNRLIEKLNYLLAY